MRMDQLMGLLRQVLPALGMVAVTLGYLDQASADNLINQITVVAGILLTATGSLWSLKANTQASILQSAGEMEDVRVVEVSDEKLASQIKSPKVRLVRK